MKEQFKENIIICWLKSDMNLEECRKKFNKNSVKRKKINMKKYNLFNNKKKSYRN